MSVSAGTGAGPWWVYAIRNLATGERWVGGAADVARAWRRHRRRLKEGTHTNLALQEAWETQGPDAFLVERLEAVAERTALQAQVRAWIAQAETTYNKHWHPRLRPRVVTYRQGQEVRHLTIYPPTVVHRIEMDVDPAAPQLPIVVRQTTYRLPFAARDLPLLLTATGLEYVPIEAWCDVLGVRLRTHLWRLRRMGLWREARELLLAPVPGLGQGLGPRSDSACAGTGTSTGTSTGTGTHDVGRTGHPRQLPDRQAGGRLAFRIRAAAVQAQGHGPDVGQGAGQGAAAPAWCLPRDRFLLFTLCLGWQRIDAALHPALDAMWEDEEADYERRRRARAERVAAYGVVRQRAMSTLLACDGIVDVLRAVDELMAPRLAAVAGAELAALSAQGRLLVLMVADAARAVLGELRSGGITELTEYDPGVDAMRTRIVPRDPTLPDASTLTALDTCEASLLAWTLAFTRFTRHQQWPHREADGPDYGTP